MLGGEMLPDELLARSQAIREAYHELELKHHGSEWTVEEDLQVLTNDIGNVARLAMTQQGVLLRCPPMTWVRS